MKPADCSQSPPLDESRYARRARRWSRTLATPELGPLALRADWPDIRRPGAAMNYTTLIEPAELLTHLSD
ncbi:MAG TPA: hypothetical protein VLB75_04945, partial [Steroidobacteraceae bacterium]|nr:hypothetical protein [Steroidobacteraceae bacterium]